MECEYHADIRMISFGTIDVDVAVDFFIDQLIPKIDQLIPKNEY